MSSPSCGPCACVHACLEAGWQGQRGLKVGLWGSELNDPQIHAAGLFSPTPPGGAASHRRKGRRGRGGGPGISELERCTWSHSFVRACLGATGLGTRFESQSCPSSTPFRPGPSPGLPGKMGAESSRRPRRAKPRVPALWVVLIPSLLFLLTCPGVLNLLFSAALSKEKLKTYIVGILNKYQ